VSSCEKCSLEAELTEMKAAVEVTESSKQQLQQQHKLISDELLVIRQQQVTSDA